MQAHLGRRAATQVLLRAQATAPCVQFLEQYAARLLLDARKLAFLELQDQGVDPNPF